MYLIYNINKEQELFGRLHTICFSIQGNTQTYHWHVLRTLQKLQKNLKLHITNANN